MKFVKGFVYMAVMTFATATFAQEAVKEEIKDIKISGKAYLEWNKELSNYDDTTEHQNTFEIKRVYLDFKKEFDSVWSARVTTDVGQVESEGEAEVTDTASGNPETVDVKAKSDPYTVYVKYAYIQAKQKMDFVDANFKFGMIGTPLIGLIDDKSDYRWVEQNYVDQAKNIIGTSIDSSADMGVSVDLSFFKMVKLSGSLVNGEGYKKVNEDELGDDGKAYYGMLTITPVKGLDIFGTYRNQITDDGHGSDNYSRYMAFGASYSTDLVKVGAMYVMPEVKKGGVENEYTLIDSWLLANLESVINIPILITGRYSYGENEDVDDSEVTIWAAGLGYAINKNIRVMAYYQDADNDAKEDPETTFYVKTEVAF